MEILLQSMAYPFLACLVLTGIHVYLGLHVIERKVIFVDLALATIAALGAVWGALLGWDIHEDSWAIKGFSLAFTFVGAAVFSVTRMRYERVPHEAIIGIAYAVALAALILGSAKLPHGAEEVRELQAGSILWVSGSTIAGTAGLYALIGVFHFVFRKRFLAISLDPDGAEAKGIHVRFWDFLFYVSFGFVVTSSVAIAGVLLVFSYLVIPSVVAVLFADRIGPRLAIGWTVGTLVSAAGVTVSYYGDLPSGPVIVVCFGVFLALTGIYHSLSKNPDKRQAWGRVGVGLLAAALLFPGSLLFRKEGELELAHVLETGTRSERVAALARVAADPALWDDVAPLAEDLLADPEIEVRLGFLSLIAELRRDELLPLVEDMLEDHDDLVREEALFCLEVLDRPESAEAILRAAAIETDDFLKVEMAHAVLEFGDRRGVPFLLDVMEEGVVEQARRDAHENLRSHADVALSYRPDADAEARRREVEAFRAWWEANRLTLEVH